VKRHIKFETITITYSVSLNSISITKWIYSHGN